MRASEKNEHTMVGAANHHDTIITLEPIDFVQEKALDFVSDETVEIFEHQETGRHISCFDEDLTDRVLGPVTASQGLDIEGRDWVQAGVQSMHECFDGTRLAIAG